VSSKTPPETQRALSAALSDVLSREDILQQIRQAGASPTPISGEDVQRIIRADSPVFARIVKTANIKVD
jgi:tripartite-type tricarboxylate transporter receptor subunit TctC